MYVTIAFSGTKSSGKTTMARQLYKVLSKKHRVFLDIKQDRQEIWNDMLIQQNLQGFDFWYYNVINWIISDLHRRAICIQTQVRFLIYDESIYDILAYAMCVKSITDEQKDFLTRLVLEHERNFEIKYLIYLEPIKFIQNIEKNVEKKLMSSMIDSELVRMYECKLIHELPDLTIEKRVEKALQIITE